MEKRENNIGKQITEKKTESKHIELNKHINYRVSLPRPSGYAKCGPAH